MFLYPAPVKPINILFTLYAITSQDFHIKEKLTISHLSLHWCHTTIVVNYAESKWSDNMLKAEIFLTSSSLFTLKANVIKRIANRLIQK